MRTFPERTMPREDGMDCTADLTEKNRQVNESALKAVPSPRLENAPSPRLEADEIECDAGRTHGPGQEIHAPLKRPLPLPLKSRPHLA